MIWALAFWKGAGERALKTFLQSFIPALLLGLGASTTGVFDAFHAPWLTALLSALSVAVGAAFLSLCTSVGNASFTAGITSTAAATVTDPAVITSLPAVAEITSAPEQIDTGIQPEGTVADSGVPPTVDQPAA